MSRKCLLGVYAHPADESIVFGGTLVKYSDAGVKTALICATRDATDMQPPRSVLATERSLQVACDILGVGDLNALDYPAGTLTYADALEVIGSLVYHIRRLRPQVVVTFDEPGVYGNLDHAAIHRLTVSAFFRASDSVWYPEQLQAGLQPYQPQNLYVHMLGCWRAQTRPRSPAERGVGTLIHITLDDKQLDAKLAAIRAYQSEPKPDVAIGDLVRGALRVECFKRLVPRTTTTADDLFAGGLVDVLE